MVQPPNRRIDFVGYRRNRQIQFLGYRRNRQIEFVGYRRNRQITTKILPNYRRIQKKNPEWRHAKLEKMGNEALLREPTTTCKWGEFVAWAKSTDREMFCNGSGVVCWANQVSIRFAEWAPSRGLSSDCVFIMLSVFLNVPLTETIAASFHP